MPRRSDQIRFFPAIPNHARLAAPFGDPPPLPSRTNCGPASCAARPAPPCSVLPAHRSFARILTKLRYVVVDEGHAYRGVFGCHTAMVLRRLTRLCSHVYGSSPRFVVTSATVANPQVCWRAGLGVGRAWEFCLGPSMQCSAAQALNAHMHETTELALAKAAFAQHSASWQASMMHIFAFPLALTPAARPLPHPPTHARTRGG